LAGGSAAAEDFDARDVRARAFAPVAAGGRSFAFAAPAAGVPFFAFEPPTAGLAVDFEGFVAPAPFAAGSSPDLPAAPSPPPISP